MPAEILQETGGGLVLVGLPDGSTRELPYDLAQQVVEQSYANGTPSYADATGQGIHPPQSVSTAYPATQPYLPSTPVQSGVEVTPNASDTLPPEAPTPTPETIAPDIRAETPPAPPAGLLAPRGNVSTRSSSSVSVPLGGPPTAPPGGPDLAAQQAAVVGAANRQQELNEQSRAIDAGLAAIDEVYAPQVSAIDRDAAKQHANASAYAQKEVDKYFREHAEAMRFVPNMDPKRLWKNKSDFGRASTLIFAAIGGWARTMSGSQNNPVLQALDKAIEDDIRSQETDIATAREKVYRTKEQFDMARESVFDRFKRIEEGKAYRKLALASLIDAEKAKYASPIAQLKHDEMSSQLRTQAEQSLVQLGEAYRKDRYSAWHDYEKLKLDRRQVRVAEMNAATNRAELEARKAEAAAKGAPAPVMVADPRTGNLWMVDPQIAKNATPTEISKMRDGEKGLAAYAEAIRIAKEYGAELAKAGRSYGGKGSTTRFLGSEERQALEQKRELAVMNIRHALAGSALTASENEIWAKVLPPPTTYTSLDSVDNIDTFVKERINSAQERFVNQYRLNKQNPDGSFSKVQLQKEWGGKITPPEEPKAQDVGALNVRFGSVDFTDAATGEQTAEAAVQDAKEIVSRFDKEKEDVPPSRWVNSYRAMRDQASAAEASGHKNAATRLNKLADTLELEMLSYDKEISQGKSVYRGRRFEGGMERTPGREPVFFPLLNPPQFAE